MNWLNRGDSAVPATIISIALMLAAGFLMTRITKKLRLPNVTAYIVGGILAGPFVLNLIPQTIVEGTSFLPDIALAFIAFSTGEFFRLSALKKNGLNRLSIGVQSMHDEELRLLGRIHCAAQARQAFDMAREAGFDNINIDLMSALPGQTFESWADSLRQAVEWKPEHISAYSLIIEPGTPFSDLYDSGKLPALPDEETDRSMYHYTRRFLAQHGYERYEISNYALPGRECRHNTGYWTGHPYLGFGIGAASYVNGTRFSNTADFEAYLNLCEDDFPADNLCKDDLREDGLCEDIRTDVHVLSQEEKMEEFMFLGLRMTAGVSGAEFASRFHKTLDEAYGTVIRRHVAQGLLQPTAEGFCLTERGTDVSNYVMADYLI